MLTNFWIFIQEIAFAFKTIYVIYKWSDMVTCIKLYYLNYSQKKMQNKTQMMQQCMCGNTLLSLKCASALRVWDNNAE